MSFMVLVTERLSEGLRGVVSKWLVEVNPGIYVGTTSTRIREALWAEIGGWVLAHEVGYALLIYPARNDQGFAMTSYGESAYEVGFYDGLALIRRQHQARQVRPSIDEVDPGW